MNKAKLLAQLRKENAPRPLQELVESTELNTQALKAISDRWKSVNFDKHKEMIKQIKKEFSTKNESL